MAVLQKVFLVLSCVCLLGGCYEDLSDLTLNTDGSGTLKQKLVISERLVVAASEGSLNKKAPPVSKEKVLEKVGSALEISSITQTELPDGGRIIEFEGTFETAEQFFLSEFCRNTLKLRLVPAGDGKAAIYCEMSKGTDGGGPTTTQLYGMLKGLYVKRTVHLPTEIEKTNAEPGEDKNTVSWVMDLRNKEGLDRTIAFEKSEDKGIGSVVFDAGPLEFSLPLKTVAISDTTSTEPKGPVSLKAVVSWIAVKKKIELDSNSPEAVISNLEFGLTLTWSEPNSPFACHTPVLTNIQDDLNTDLVKDTYKSVYTIHSSLTKKELKIKTKTPGSSAKKIRNLEGYVPVVMNVKKAKVTLTNMQELVGRETTGYPILDKLHFKIKSIEGPRLSIQIDGGSKTITSLDIFAEDGSTVKRQGGMGSGDSYSYDFAGVLSKLNRCQIEVIASQKIVNVPFSLKEVSLP